MLLLADAQVGSGALDDELALVVGVGEELEVSGGTMGGGEDGDVLGAALELELGLMDALAPAPQPETLPPTPPPPP